MCVCERYRESKGIPFRVKSLILARRHCEGEASRGEKRVRRRLNWIGGKVGEGRGGRSPAGRMLSFFLSLKLVFRSFGVCVSKAFMQPLIQLRAPQHPHLSFSAPRPWPQHTHTHFATVFVFHMCSGAGIQPAGFTVAENSLARLASADVMKDADSAALFTLSQKKRPFFPPTFCKTLG